MAYENFNLKFKVGHLKNPQPPESFKNRGASVNKLSNLTTYDSLVFMSQRRDYEISITVNSRAVTRVVIDPHYQLKHSDSIDDGVILSLVQMLDEKTFTPEAEKDGFQYFKTDPIALNGVNYRLIWLLEKNEIYVGVINAFRR